MRNDARHWISNYQNAGCEMFAFDAPERPDYPARTDLLAGYTVIPELWRRAHGGTAFRIDDLMRNDEVFCYVKIDGTKGLGESSFADREEIEEALDEALSAEDLGCVIGVGTGRRYSYVDVALADVVAGYEVIRRVLRAGNIPNRTWILHFDGNGDALGIWNDTPPVPG